MKGRERGRGPGVNIGTASLVMVFSVLCLTVFAVLSLLTARSELKLSRSLAQAVSSYYAADCEAVGIVDLLAAGGQAPGVTVTGSGEDTRYSFAVDVNDYQQISVLLDADFQILAWKTVYVGEWSPDDGMQIWSGEAVS